MAPDFKTCMEDLSKLIALISIIWWSISSGALLAALEFGLENLPAPAARVNLPTIQQDEPLSPPKSPLIFFHAPVVRSHQPFESFESTGPSVSKSDPAPIHVRWMPTKTSPQLLQSTALAVLSISTPSPGPERHLRQSSALALLPLPASAPGFSVQWSFVPKWPLAPPMRWQSTAIAVISLPVPFRAQSKSPVAPPQHLQSTDVALTLTPARRPYHAPLSMQFNLQFMLNQAHSAHDPLTAVAVVPPGTCPLQGNPPLKHHKMWHHKM
jgi:hypothetical protein